MDGNAGYYRSQRSRYRPARKEAPRGDAVVVALTVQVIICVLLLLAANLAKNSEHAGYGQVRGQYDSMVSDQARQDQVMEYFSDPQGYFSGLFSALEEWLAGLLGGNRRSGEEPLAEPPAPADEEVGYDFGYGYLGREDVLFAQAAPGQGGEFPVFTGTNREQLEAPEGSVLSPVYLAGAVRPPVSGLITSPFSYRIHPITGQSDFHTGIDIGAREGAPILAALPGQVVEVGESNVYGNYIIVQHATNLRTFYAHCSEILAGEGAAVRQGERIARVGQTGMATGPHLHFSVIIEGQFTDPAWILADHIQLVEE